VAVAGSPERSGATSEPTTASVVDAVSLAGFKSLEAPVVPLMAAVPTVVGVPETVQVMDAPAASGDAVGTIGAQVCVKPAGRPVAAQVAPMAAAAGDAALVHLNVLE
jgi:hypothetical protein